MQDYQVEPLEVTIDAPCQVVCDAISMIFDHPVQDLQWSEVGETKWANFHLPFGVQMVDIGEEWEIPTKYSLELSEVQLRSGGSTAANVATEIVVRLSARCTKPDWIEDDRVMSLLEKLNEFVVGEIKDFAEWPDAADGYEAEGPEAA